jgi:hypothetical protein
LSLPYFLDKPGEHGNSRGGGGQNKRQSFHNAEAVQAGQNFHGSNGLALETEYARQNLSLEE